eukprot:Nk52_evm27s225 gene=Nk52_evmTU27s225
MLGKHFTTIMSVICIMILLMAVTRTEASPVLGNDHVNYRIDRIYFRVGDITCFSYPKGECVLPAKEGLTVTCSIDGENTRVCKKPNNEKVTFKRISDTEMGMEGLDIPNEYVDVPSEGEGKIQRWKTGAELIINGPRSNRFPKRFCRLTILLKPIN